MIVRESGSSLVLVTQPDHARLARQIVEPWPALAASGRRASILLAIEEHDNGWRELDARPLVDSATGRLLDFVNAPAPLRQEVWPRGVERLSSDPWAAALVALHALTVYDRYLPHPEWAAFFATMTEARDRHLAAAGRTLDDLRGDYVFLRVGDLASLVFCNAWTEELGFGGLTVQLDRSRLLLTPDPYEGREIPFQIAARELPRRPYHSEEEARAAFAAARPVALSGTAVGRGS